MKFFPGLMKVFAAAGAAALYAIVNAAKDYFGSANPSDVNPLVWSGVAFAAVLALNFALGKLKTPSA